MSKFWNVLKGVSVFVLLTFPVFGTRAMFQDMGTSQVTHVYSEPGTYTAVFTVIDATGTKAEASVPITVLPSPVITVTATGSPTIGDAPLRVQFQATVTGGTAPFYWRWTFGDKSSSSKQNPNHRYKAGSYTATVYVTDSRGVTGQASVSIIAL